MQTIGWPVSGSTVLGNFPMAVILISSVKSADSPISSPPGAATISLNTKGHDRTWGYTLSAEYGNKHYIYKNKRLVL